MNKIQFLATLRRLLKELPEDERERILDYYREIIDDKIESGQTEEEAVLGLGNVYALAQKILAENPNRRPKNVGKIILIVILSILGVCIIAGLCIGFSVWHAVGTHGGWNISVPYVSDSYEYKSYTEKADGINSLSISAEDKAVVIEPEDSGPIQVKYAWNQHQHYEIHAENGTFSIKNTEDGGRWRSGWGWNDSAPTITVTVPKTYSGTIRIDTSDSYIKASGLDRLGSLSCDTTNSAINVNDLSARTLDFQTLNAAIEMKNVSASEKIDADTTNAQIGLNGIASPNISLQTQNALITGTIRGREDDYTISAQTTNAISNLKNRTGGEKKLSVETTNGIIRVSFED